MKNINRIFALVIIVITLVFLGANLYVINIPNESGRPYKIEAVRVADEISKVGIKNIDLSKYSFITNIEVLSNSNDDKTFFQGENSDYIIREINDKYYRIDYINQEARIEKNVLVAMNIALAAISVLIIGILIFIRFKLIKPFNSMVDVPFELSKGNLTVPLKENKSRYFGQFIWGMDLLRENIEEQKIKELELQKEKKTLVLSISHDVKTPLSAIKLYSKALSKNLYSDSEKQKEIAENINEKADEIESFISQIIKASSEDFLQFEVENHEFYLSQLFDSTIKYYNEKLELLHIDFKVLEHENCLIKGDFNRSIEVLQNIIENAVKYGDGHAIKIGVADEENCKLITITNSGCNLSANELPHIFDSFWRGSNVGNNGGSGLGLYICRQLMLKMDGEIFADKDGDNLNVTVVFQRA